LYGKIRYLGVILDKNLTFAPHVEFVTKKASRTAAALVRLMPNIGGPSEWKRKLLGTVVDSQLLYAAPAWIGKATIAAWTRSNLIRPQRTVALRTIRAYRTVSDEAALVLGYWPRRSLPTYSAWSEKGSSPVSPLKFRPGRNSRPKPRFRERRGPEPSRHGS